MMKKVAGTSLAAMLAFGPIPASAADPSGIMGRWIEKFPNGRGMVVEFTQISISQYPVDEANKQNGPEMKMTVTYKDIGDQSIGVVFSDGAGILVLKRSPTEITMDFPGAGAHEMTKLH